MVCQAICGLRPNPDGIEIRPYLPRGINRLSIKGLKFGKMTLDIDLQGQGYRIVDFRVDGRKSANHFIAADETGRRHIEIRLDRPRFP